MGRGKDADHKDFIPILGNQGVKNLVGTDQRGLQIQYARYTKDGAGDDAIQFSDLEDPGGNALKSMASASYMVLIENESDDTIAIRGADSDTARTADGFTIPGAAGADGDQLNILIIGQIAGAVGPA